MEKIMIYPYSKFYESYVRYQNMLNNAEINTLISPRGWGLEEELIIHDKGELVVGYEFSENLEQCTTVWFVEDANLKLPEKILWKNVQEAVLKNKKIIYTRNKDKTQYEYALKLIPKNQNITPDWMVEELPNQRTNRKCLDINTPVLTIFGLEENTEKFEVQLALRKKFIDKGYKVTSITSRCDSEIFNMHSLPLFMLRGGLSETDKIIQYNHYVKSIELMEKPDLIIVGIPGGAMPYDKLNHNNFGILTYEISFAVPSDIAIMCILYNSNFEGDYSEFREDIKIKFGFNIEYCHIASVTLDTQTILDDGKRGFVNIDKYLVRNKVKVCNKKNIVDLTDNNYLEAVVEDIIKKLSVDFIS